MRDRFLERKEASNAPSVMKMSETRCSVLNSMTRGGGKIGYPAVVVFDSTRGVLKPFWTTRAAGGSLGIVILCLRGSANTSVASGYIVNRRRFERELEAY